MAGTISSTTQIFKVDDHDLAVANPRCWQQGHDFMEFAKRNGITEPGYFARFDQDTLGGAAPVQYHVVYEKREGKGKPESFGASLNTQVAGPQTANADVVDLRDFYGMGRTQPPLTWNDFAYPQQK